MQNLVDGLNDSLRLQRKDYHVTLGELIETLEGIEDDDLPVIFSDGTSPHDPRSYRGHYSDLAFDSTDEMKTVSEVLEMAEKVHDEALMGYKGGEFVMDDDTPLWQAEWGSMGDAVISMDINHRRVRLGLKSIYE